MAAYYYLLSSLPHLRWPGPAPLADEDFMEQCVPWVRGRDQEQLVAARTDIEHIPQEGVTAPVIRQWIAFENTLRNRLVLLRAEELGTAGGDAFLRDRGFDAAALSPAARAGKQSSPLEAEMTLMESRWNFLSDREPGHHFDVTAVIIYRLKLQLLNRMALFDEQRGQETLDRILETGLHGQ